MKQKPPHYVSLLYGLKTVFFCELYYLLLESIYQHIPDVSRVFSVSPLVRILIDDVRIEAARLPYSDLENEAHLMPVSLLVAATVLDAADLRVIQSVPVRA